LAGKNVVREGLRLELAEFAAARLGPLLGTAADELCVCGQTTSNLHQLLATLYDPDHPTRRVLVGDTLNFASFRRTGPGD